MRFFAAALILLISVTGTGLLAWWLTFDPASEITASFPGEDGRPSGAAASAPRVTIGEYYAAFEGSASEIGGEWPRFRGTRFDNSATGPPVADELPNGKERIRWSVSLGEGYAGAAVSGGKVYVLDYLEDERADALRCFSLDDGEEIWRRWYGVDIKRNHGRSRTVPSVADGYAVTIGPECHVMCVNAETGELLWTLDLAADFGTEVPLWYTGQCPIIDNGLAVIAAGGESLVMAVECESGAVVWQTPNPERFLMSHSSIIPMTIHGRYTYVYCAVGAVVGIDPETGQELWRTTDFNAKVIAPSPVYLGDGLIWVTAGYGAGSILIRVLPDLTVETVSRNRPQEGFACEQQTPLEYRGLLYGIMPKDGGALRNEFVCWDPDQGLVWASGETSQYGLGPFMRVGNTFLILSDEGVLTAADAEADRFAPLWSVQILDGTDSWGPMAYVDGLLIARDSYTMVCVDMRG